MQVQQMTILYITYQCDTGFFIMYTAEIRQFTLVDGVSNIPANQPTLHKDIFISYNITLGTCKNIRKWLYLDSMEFYFVTYQAAFTCILQGETVFLSKKRISTP